MTGKSALYALAVLALTGFMAVAVLADDRGMDAYGPDDSSLSGEPVVDEAQPEVGEIRGPLGTGAVPDRMEENSAGQFTQDAGDEPTEEINGKLYRTNIDLVP